MPRIDDVLPIGKLANDPRFIDELDKRRRPPVFKYQAVESSEFPELVIECPKSWSHVILAPFFDVHLGHHRHDAKLFAKHKRWVIDTPNVITWNGGDFIENASKLSVGAGVYEQDYTPQNQLCQAAFYLAEMSRKLAFSIGGNHEARNNVMGVDVAQWVSWLIRRPFFSDYCLLTVKFRTQKFRLHIHHGSGGAQTLGGLMMAAAKDLAWSHADIWWSGHTHKALNYVVPRYDHNQRTDRVFARDALIVVSPSYLGHFGTYGAAKRYMPGTRGLSVVRLWADGRIDADIHARGKRL